MHHLRLLLLGFVAALAGPSWAAEPVALDDFLAGFHANCAQSDDFETMKRTMVKGGDGWSLTRRTVLPAAVRPAVGQARFADEKAEDGSVAVIVPLANASYRGLKVSGLRIGYAEGYPLIDDSILFDAPFEAVKEALAADLAAFDQEKAGEIVEFRLEKVDGAPRLTCFATN
jgi:hypothetical protein